MSQANINPDILSWARQRAGLSMSALAGKLHINEEKLEAWETGKDKPTFRQAQDYAHHTHVPFGYLFLKQSPIDELPIPDLRMIGSHSSREISLDLLDTVRDVLKRQLWFQEYQMDRGAEPISVVGCVSLQTPIIEIVNRICELLGLTDKPKRGSWEAYFSDLIKRIESLGILVMRSSMVGSNTHRLLNVKEFRGFAIADKFAPVIFINSSDCPEARLFTLIHELAHILLGESGISDAEPGNHRRIEAVCNAIAAEFLAPELEFREYWQSNDDWSSNLPILANHFNVSQWVVARRALELELIGELNYRTYVDKLLADHKAREKGGNIPYGRVQTTKVSRRLAEAVVSEALSGRILLRDAWQLIGIKPHKLVEFGRKELEI